MSEKTIDKEIARCWWDFLIAALLAVNIIGATVLICERWAR